MATIAPQGRHGRATSPTHRWQDDPRADPRAAGYKRAMPTRRPPAPARAAALALGTLAVTLAAAPAVPRAVGAARAPAPRAPAADTGGGAHAHRAHGAASRDSLTPAARAQLEAVRRATAALATPEAARAAGFRPVFGQVPLQGEHYVRMDRVLAGTFEVERPSTLIFAPVAGRPALVGVAYAFLHPAGAAPPSGFDGAGEDVWHTHAALSPDPRRALVMMHAWFDPAPDGPWARYNPRLPYLAAGLTPPGAAVLADSAAGLAARRLGLALAIATTPPMLFQYLARQGDDALRARVAEHQAAVAALVPRLAAAERAGDAAARARLAAEAVRHGDALVAGLRRRRARSPHGAPPRRPHRRRVPRPRPRHRGGARRALRRGDGRPRGRRARGAGRRAGPARPPPLTASRAPT
jgi:hypothetical protein